MYNLNQNYVRLLLSLVMIFSLIVTVVSLRHDIDEALGIPLSVWIAVSGGLILVMIIKRIFELRQRKEVKE